MTDAQINALHIDQQGGTRYNLSDFDPAELIIPTFEQVLQQCVKYGMKMVIRVSLFPNGYDTVSAEMQARWDTFFGLLKQYGVKSTDVSCYLETGSKASVCRRFLGDDVEISTFLGSSATAQDFIDYFAARTPPITGNRAAIINYRNADLEAIKLLHENGIRAYVYDTNSEEEAMRCASIGVDIFQNNKTYELFE